MVRYWHFPGGLWWDMMDSTSYSSSDSIRSGGGEEKLGPCGWESEVIHEQR